LLMLTPAQLRGVGDSAQGVAAPAQHKQPPPD